MDRSIAFCMYFQNINVSTVFAHNRHIYGSFELLQNLRGKIFFLKFSKILTFQKITIDVPNVCKYCWNIHNLKVEINPQFLSVLASSYDKNSFFYGISNLRHVLWIFSFFEKYWKFSSKMPKCPFFLQKKWNSRRLWFLHQFLSYDNASTLDW